MENMKILVLLRVLSTLLLILAVCLIVFDSQTKVFFSIIVRKASFRDLSVLFVLVCIDSAAVAYNVLQILRCHLFPNPFDEKDVAWICYLLDQAISYVVFASNSAAIQGSFIAITGEPSLQWMELCDKYRRFCVQMGGALACNFVACIILALISCVSACNLFRLYSPRRIFQLKLKYDTMYTVIY